MAADNYEVPIDLNNSKVKPEHIRARSIKVKGLAVAVRHAKHGYHMKSGDIFVVWGFNTMGVFVGHSAVALSASKVIHMPGWHKHAQVYTKKHFFQKYTKKGGYVQVYRLTKHPHVAAKAAKYAYKYMYKKHNPSYKLTFNLYRKSPSYCSKYVYLSYYRGGTHKSVKKFLPEHLVAPHTYIRDWKGSYKPKDMYTITAY